MSHKQRIRQLETFQFETEPELKDYFIHLNLIVDPETGKIFKYLDWVKSHKNDKNFRFYWLKETEEEMAIKNRIAELEKIQNKNDPNKIEIFVKWDDLHIDIKTGEKLTDAEFLARYPDSKIITWDDLPKD